MNEAAGSVDMLQGIENLMFPSDDDKSEVDSDDDDLGLISLGKWAMI